MRPSPAPSPSPARQADGTISAYAVLNALANVRAAGLETGPLTEGLGFDEKALRRPGARASWDDTVVLMDRVAAACGSAARLEQVFESTGLAWSPLASVPGFFVSPHGLTSFVNRVGIPGVYPGFTVVQEDLGPDWMRVTISLPEGYAPSVPIVRATVGAYRGMPRVLGAPDARVEAEVTGTRGVFEVRLPPAHTARALFSKVAREVVAKRAARRADSPPLATLLGDLGAAWTHAVREPLRPLEPADPKDLTTSVLEGAVDLAAPLLDARDFEATAAEIGRILEREFGRAHVAVSLRGADARARAHIWPSAASSGDAVVAFDLNHAGRSIGQLECDAKPWAPGAQARLRALLPMFALALARVRQAPPPSLRDAHHGETSRRARLDGASRSWKLTSRELEVLDLLVEGLSNKEIAARLGCAVGTAEIHVASVLRKSGADSRARLIARFWTDHGARG